MQKFCFQASSLTWQLHGIEEETAKVAIIPNPKFSALEGLV